MIFRPLRHFSWVSFMGCLVLAVSLGWFYQHVAAKQLLAEGEQHNVALTQVLSYALRPHLAIFWQEMAKVEPKKMQAHVAIGNIREAVQGAVHGLSIAKVKIFGGDGMTLFSSQESQIGEDQAKNWGVIAAMQGTISSELIYQEHFITFDGEVENRSLIETYVPLRLEDKGKIVGVFEIYRDITPLLLRVKQTSWMVAAAVALAMFLLYVLLFGIVRRAQRLLGEHEWQKDQYIRQINAHAGELETKVMERTQALTQSNLALQVEVAVRRQAEEELCLAATAFANTKEGIVVTDRQGVIVSINPAFTEITGYPLEEAKGQNMRLLQSGRHDRLFYQNMWNMLQNAGRWSGEIWNRRKNLEIYPQLLNISAVRDPEGQIHQYVGIFLDISALKETQRRLDHLSYHDALTGLPKRELVLDRLRQSIALADRFEQQVGVMHLGLDRFKWINETLGMPIGDRILEEVAKRLLRCLREGDTVSRVGNDEFMVVVTGISDVQNITRVGRKILDQIAQPIYWDDESVQVNASMGITVFPFDNGDPESLLRNATAAFHQAKALGGGQYQHYTQKIGEMTNRRISIESRLRYAMDRGEFMLYYQPQLDVITGRVVGMEALLRWNSPDLGMVSPVQFIPIAEENGLIIPLGEWVLRTACDQLARWRDQGYPLFRMAVNLSARQFQQPNLVNIITQILADTGLDPQWLELELTEGMVMSDVRSAVEILADLKGRGIAIAIDDFGTGYSSLSYLRRFPIHTLKIDRAFVRDVAVDPEDAAIARTIIAMAKALNLQVVAEGVSSVEQLEFLRIHQCEFVQGFLFSPPVAPDEAVQFLVEDSMFRNLKGASILPENKENGQGGAVQNNKVISGLFQENARIARIHGR